MKCAIPISFVCLVLLSGCGPHIVKAPHSLPAAVQMRLLHAPPRVWVAGFVGNAGTDRVDLNAETVRFVRQELRAVGSIPFVVDADPLVFDGEETFEDEGYWSRLAEEHGLPLIVTGTVRMVLAPPVIVQRAKRTMYFARAGRVLDATVVLIDGHTGKVINRQKLPRRMRYGDHDVVSGLGLYLEMMAQSRVDWLNAITQAVH